MQNNTTILIIASSVFIILSIFLEVNAENVLNSRKELIQQKMEKLREKLAETPLDTKKIESFQMDLGGSEPPKDISEVPNISFATVETNPYEAIISYSKQYDWVLFLSTSPCLFTLLHSLIQQQQQHT